MTSKQAQRAEERRREVEQALTETIEDTIRRDGPKNALVWGGVTLGAFVLNLVLLIIVTGG